MHHTQRPHDLLWGMTFEQLPADAPDWARQVLVDGQPVVVRRALLAAAQLPIGIRGLSRDQRYASVMPASAVLRSVSPEQLVVRLPVATLPALRALALLKPHLDDLGLAWGVTGSVGYQLATGIETAHANSDLDLLLRTPLALCRRRAGELQRRLDEASCRVDMQLETPSGGVALREWAGESTRVLVKCVTGARLIENPWSNGLDERERVA